MKLNEKTRIIGDRVVLVPYKKHHVLKYHDWMALEEIQELTCSEPLSLEEEYQMQLNWVQDNDKLTFIILRKDWYEQDLSKAKEDREIYSMVGDINVTITTESVDDSEDSNENVFGAELSVMIVDKEHRGHGFGIEAVFLMMNYCIMCLTSPRIEHFLAKINLDNEPSIKMFEKLGFEKYKIINVFKEVFLKFEIN